MFEKIVEVVLQKYFQPRTRKQKDEDRVRKKIVFLHESLVRCHSAYLHHLSEPSAITTKNWSKAINELAHVVHDVRLALSVFEPEASLQVEIYLNGEARMDEARRMIATDWRLPNNENRVSRSRKSPRDYDIEFNEATQKLRQFMREHMTMGEIQRAQETFRGTNDGIEL